MLLCYSNPDYGVGLIPQKIWLNSQVAESNLWKNTGKEWGKNDANDRASEHLEGFKSYSGFDLNADLGHMIEVGAGPWTQARILFFQRPDLKVKSLTLLEPSASFYQANVKTCSYKHG